MTRGEKGNGSRENLLLCNVMWEIKTVYNIESAIWPQLCKTSQPKNTCTGEKEGDRDSKEIKC